MARKRNVLLVSAHPDDMEIGMGGTVAKLAEQGALLTSIIFTDGRRGPNPFGRKPDEMVKLRMKEAGMAAKILGVQQLIFCNLPELKSRRHSEIAASKLRQVISKIRPVEIYTLHPQLDRHATHRLAGKLVLEAVDRNDSAIWAYEVWGLFPTWDRFEDISNQIGRKLKAISQHKSQLAGISYQDGVLGLNRWRAVFEDPDQTECTASYAEVFIRCTWRELNGEI